MKTRSGKEVNAAGKAEARAAAAPAGVAAQQKDAALQKDADDIGAGKVFTALNAAYAPHQSIASLRAAARAKSGLPITFPQTKAFLETKDSYTKFLVPKVHFKRRKTISYSINAQLQADLFFLPQLKRFSHRKYIGLCVVDIFSGLLYAEVLNSKKGPAVAAALEKILQRLKFRNERPIKLFQTDEGSEFFNSSVKALLKRHGIKQFSTKTSRVKASVCENIIKTLKLYLSKLMNERGTKNWTLVLNDAVSAVNNIRSRVTKLKPAQVKLSDEAKIFNLRYNQSIRAQDETLPSEELEVGALVRKIIDDAASVRFKKSSTANYSSEIYRVVKCIDSFPPTYEIAPINKEGLLDESVDRAFYRSELSRVRSINSVKLLLDPHSAENGKSTPPEETTTSRPATGN